MEFDFASATTVKTLDAVPADFRGLYKQDGDTYKLDSDHPGVKSAVSAISGLNTALKASRAEAKAARDRVVDLAPLADYGDSPTAIAEAFNERLKKATKGSSEDVAKQVTAARDALNQEHAKQTKALQDANANLTAQLHKLLVGQAATAALLEAEAVDVDLAMPHVASQVRAVPNDSGEIVVQVVDARGDVRYSGVSGAPMTIKELVEGMKGQTKFGPLFKSSSHSGSGSPPTRRAGGAPAGANATSVQKIAAGLNRSGAVRRGKE